MLLDNDADPEEGEDPKNPKDPEEGEETTTKWCPSSERKHSTLLSVTSPVNVRTETESDSTVAFILLVRKSICQLSAELVAS
jgi:hypothetical protein